MTAPRPTPLCLAGSSEDAVRCLDDWDVPVVHRLLSRHRFMKRLDTPGPAWGSAREQRQR